MYAIQFTILCPQREVPPLHGGNPGQRVTLLPRVMAQRRTPELQAQHMSLMPFLTPTVSVVPLRTGGSAQLLTPSWSPNPRTWGLLAVL